MKEEEYRKIVKLKGIKLFYNDNLHAKCYFNEDNLIITSLNLHKYSEENNREMGVLLSRFKIEDSEAFAEAIQEVNSIKRISDLRNKTDFVIINEFQKVYVQSASGWCIRCGSKVPLNIKRPLCKNCYSIWSKFGDPYYKENYCHICGIESSTSMEKPQCNDC